MKKYAVMKWEKIPNDTSFNGKEECVGIFDDANMARGVFDEECRDLFNKCMEYDTDKGEYSLCITRHKVCVFGLNEDFEIIVEYKVIDLSFDRNNLWGDK